MPFFSRDLYTEVVKAGHDGVHNFTYGTLEAYFYLSRAKSIEFDGSLLFIVSPYGGRAKTWVFNQDNLDMDKLAAYQRRGPVYSKTSVELTKGSNFKELVYDLPDVFSSARYKSKKKRYQRLTYPAKWMTKHGIEINQGLRKEDREHQILTLEMLHHRWVEWKMANPLTFQMMFPKKRYIETVLLAGRFPQRYQCFIAYSGDQPVAVRVLYIEGETAFDLAGFGAFWEFPGLSEHFAGMTMRLLHENGVKTLNCGASLNKYLSAFKTHWPNRPLLSYAYGQVKDAE